MTNAMWAPIDIYCERLDPGFWAEPLNALSNLSFFVAAMGIGYLARKNRVLDQPTIMVLIVLLLCIGTGSFLFHTLAVAWASAADVLPILLFQISFLVFYTRKVAGVTPLRAAMLVVGFFALSTLMARIPPEWVNGSNSYFSALVFLGGLGVYHRATHRHGPWLLLGAVGVFVLSLTFRSIDMAVCLPWPWGTHILWHLLNGMVLYMVARAYVLNVPHPHVVID